MVGDEYRGEGLGSYLLCGVLTWLKEHYPNYEVAVGSLSPVDGADPTNRMRRDTFYRRAGFSLFYHNFETGDGTFWAPAASALTPCWNTQKVEHLSAWQAVDLLLEQDDQLRDVTSRFKTIKHWNRDLDEEVRRWRAVAATTASVLVALAVVYANFCR
jgi:hypothetical protein